MCGNESEHSVAEVPVLRTVLLIEDDPDIQNITRRILERMAKLVVTVCSSGHEALTLAPTYRPQLILLDLMMPEMDGLETLQALRQFPELAHTPVILMTASIQAPKRAEYPAIGIQGVIAKPFTPITLLSDIHRIWSAHYDVLVS